MFTQFQEGIKQSNCLVFRASTYLFRIMEEIEKTEGNLMEEFANFAKELNLNFMKNPETKKAIYLENYLKCHALI